MQGVEGEVDVLLVIHYLKLRLLLWGITIIRAKHCEVFTPWDLFPYALRYFSVDLKGGRIDIYSMIKLLLDRILGHQDT